MARHRTKDVIMGFNREIHGEPRRPVTVHETWLTTLVSGRLQLIDPALLGTCNVLQPSTVNRTTSISRVVLTSTTGAIFGDYIDVMEMTSHTLSEKYFKNSSSVENNPYHYAKVLAEHDVLVKLIGPFFGLNQQYILNHVDIRFAIDNTRSIRDLGNVYRPIEDTLIAAFALKPAPSMSIRIEIKEIGTIFASAEKVVEQDLSADTTLTISAQHLRELALKQLNPHRAFCKAKSRLKATLPTHCNGSPFFNGTAIEHIDLYVR